MIQGDHRRMFGIVQDIAARKRAEEDPRESERRYRETQMELAHINRVTTMGQLTASITHEVNQLMQRLSRARTPDYGGLRPNPLTSRKLGMHSSVLSRPAFKPAISSAAFAVSLRKSLRKGHR